MSPSIHQNLDSRDCSVCISFRQGLRSGGGGIKRGGGQVLLNLRRWADFWGWLIFLSARIKNGYSTQLKNDRLRGKYLRRDPSGDEAVCPSGGKRPAAFVEKGGKKGPRGSGGSFANEWEMTVNVTEQYYLKASPGGLGPMQPGSGGGVPSRVERRGGVRSDPPRTPPTWSGVSDLKIGQWRGNFRHGDFGVNPETSHLLWDGH